MLFEKYAAKGNEWINKIAQLGEMPEDQAGRILKATLHALRNRLTIEESFHLLSQLPMALKGVYVDGWRVPQRFERIRHLHEFLDDIRSIEGATAAYDLGNDQKAKERVGIVFQILHEHISEGEMENILGQFSEEIRHFIQIQKREQPTIW